VKEYLAHILPAGYLGYRLSNGCSQHYGFCLGEPDSRRLMSHSHKGSFKAVCWVKNDSDFFPHVLLEHVEYGERQI